MEMDYYTAVDDLQVNEADDEREKETGAGMVGLTGFNSACLYRYARLDWEQLHKNLDGDTALARRTVEAFLRSTESAIPSGKQNSSAAHSRPSFLLGVVRSDAVGWSLVNAFEKPIMPHGNSALVEPSVRALDAYWERLRTVYGTESLNAVAALALDPGLDVTHLTKSIVPDLKTWINTIMEVLPKEATA
jgi:CRISPR system Cascade subunit CasC